MTEAERERIEGRRFWSALMLAHTVEVFESIMAGRPVLAARLDPIYLKRGLRGGALPPPTDFVLVELEWLDAIAEAGPVDAPLPPRRRGR